MWEILFDVENGRWRSRSQAERLAVVYSSERGGYFKSGVIALAPGTGGDFKIVHKLNGGSLGWILNVEWLRSLRKRREVLKSCAKLNGESCSRSGNGGRF